MDDIGRFPRAVICYCATCKKKWAWGKNEFLGCEFTCPREREDKHLARVVLDERPSFWWLRVEWLLYVWQTRFSLVPVLNRLLRYIGRNWDAEHHVVLWFVVLVLALLSESQYGRSVAYFARPVLWVFLAWRFVDVILVNVSITFTSKFPANPLRSVLLTLTGYLQVILVFAYVYAIMGTSWFPGYHAVRQAVYFSFGTIFTVGYGNLEPKDLLPCFVVIFELCLGLFFVVTVLAQVVTWANQSQYSRGEFSLDFVRLNPENRGSNSH
jgi:hypothetical protein